MPVEGVKAYLQTADLAAKTPYAIDFSAHPLGRYRIF